METYLMGPSMAIQVDAHQIIPLISYQDPPRGASNLIIPRQSAYHLWPGPRAAAGPRRRDVLPPFGEEEQLALVQRVASLLSPLPGSLIFGCHFTTHDTGSRDLPLFRENDPGVHRVFSHSPES
ncbi:hypothetical protein DAEQUDRAFT_813163 [Daedalea quercina L-15889]|uniref:Uncharacterized protein n=1 Tax=Daedalea quercina L-15889 TaxID=1314783 RepID=A0A165NIQ9_9APHY|nr:hypothetical protein DAEQUDRAFT_813163 [Daedalea quercina L-15889]